LLSKNGGRNHTKFGKSQKLKAGGSSPPVFVVYFKKWSEVISKTASDRYLSDTGEITIQMEVEIDKEPVRSNFTFTS